MIFAVLDRMKLHDDVSTIAARLLVENKTYPDEATALEAVKPRMMSFYADIVNVAMSNLTTKQWVALKEEPEKYDAKYNEVLVPEVRKYVVDGHERVVEAVAKRLMEGVHFQEIAEARDSVRDALAEDHLKIIEKARDFLNNYGQSKVNTHLAVKSGTYNDLLDKAIGDEGIKYLNERGLMPGAGAPKP